MKQLFIDAWREAAREVKEEMGPYPMLTMRQPSPLDITIMLTFEEHMKRYYPNHNKDAYV